MACLPLHHIDHQVHTVRSQTNAAETAAASRLLTPRICRLPMPSAATRTGLSSPCILLSVAVLPVCIALVYLYLPLTVTQMADDLPASIYDISVKVGSCCVSVGDLLQSSSFLLLIS